MKKYETKRHTELSKKLVAANRKREDTTRKNFLIGEKLGVGATTVYNYTCGNIPDPYLGEDILALILLEPTTTKK